MKKISARMFGLKSSLITYKNEFRYSKTPHILASTTLGRTDLRQSLSIYVYQLASHTSHMTTSSHQDENKKIVYKLNYFLHIYIYI